MDVADLREEVFAVTKLIEEQSKETKALVEAWQAAGKLVAFVKWASTLVTALGILYVFAKHFFVR